MFTSQVRETPRSQRLLFLRTQRQTEILRFFLPAWSLAHHYVSSARDVPWSMLLLSHLALMMLGNSVGYAFAGCGSQGSDPSEEEGPRSLVWVDLNICPTTAAP